MHVSVHKTLNSSRGIIRYRELSDMSEIEIRDELKTQGVVKAHRVTVKKEGKVIPTNAVSDVQPTRHTKRNCSWLFEGQTGPVCP